MAPCRPRDRRRCTSAPAASRVRPLSVQQARRYVQVLVEVWTTSSSVEASGSTTARCRHRELGDLRGAQCPSPPGSILRRRTRPGRGRDRPTRVQRDVAGAARRSKSSPQSPARSAAGDPRPSRAVAGDVVAEPASPGGGPPPGVAAGQSAGVVAVRGPPRQAPTAATGRRRSSGRGPQLQDPSSATACSASGRTSSRDRDRSHVSPARPARGQGHRSRRSLHRHCTPSARPARPGGPPGCSGRRRSSRPPSGPPIPEVVDALSTAGHRPSPPARLGGGARAARSLGADDDPPRATTTSPRHPPCPRHRPSSAVADAPAVPSAVPAVVAPGDPAAANFGRRGRSQPVNTRDDAPRRPVTVRSRPSGQGSARRWAPVAGVPAPRPRSRRRPGRPTPEYGATCTSTDHHHGSLDHEPLADKPPAAEALGRACPQECPRTLGPAVGPTPNPVGATTRVRTPSTEARLAVERAAAPPGAGPTAMPGRAWAAAARVVGEVGRRGPGLGEELGGGRRVAAAGQGGAG